MASKSLGVLTLDLVARTGGFVQGMDKAERQSKKWRKQVEKDLNTIGSGLNKVAHITAATVAASGIALTAMAKKGLDAVDAQNKLARSLNTTYDSVTALQIAFEEGGVGGYEMALARLNRRLGAAENGTGEAAKTVEALNLNLKELGRIEADERIAVIADAIRDSGASAQQAARYAQQLGFEQKEAAQFFMQGGDAIRAYRKQVRDFGLAVSAVDAIKVEQANDAFARTGRIFDAVSQQLAIQVAPILTGISELFVQNAKDAGGVAEAVEDSFDKVIIAAGFVADSVDGVRRTFEIAGSVAALTALQGKRAMLSLADSIVNFPTAAANELVSALNSLPGLDLDLVDTSDVGKRIRQEVAETNHAIVVGMKDIQDILMEPMPSTAFKSFIDGAREAANVSAEESRRILEGIQSGLGSGWSVGAGTDEPSEKMKAYQQLVQDLRTDEERLTDQLRERLAVLDAVAVASEEDYRRAASAAFTDAPNVSGLSPEVGGAFSELNRIDEEKEKLTEWYDTQLEMLANYREQRADLAEQWNEQERQLEKEHQDKLLQIEFARQQAQMAAAASTFGDLAGLARTFAGEQSGIYKALFATEKAFAIGRALINAPEAYSEAFNAVVGIPVVGPTLAPAAGAAAAAAQLAQAAAIRGVGMAHDGIDRVPTEGTWLLDKGERVLTSPQADNLDAFLASQKGGGGGGTVVNVIEDKRRGGQTETTTDSDGRENVNVFVSDIASGGPRAKVIEQTYGLRRQGR